MAIHAADNSMDSDDGASVTYRMLPGGDRQAQICLAGDIDMTALAVLSGTIDWLTMVEPVSVLVDLTGVTFACSTLPNFVVRLRHVLPGGVELILWQPGPTIMRIFRITGMGAIATVHEGTAERARAPVGGDCFSGIGRDL
ncbi:STAS domain-containing protein [Jidongwangia harbinensis]|uniref:STAS domain-containing protein n=1 Tax=Jidongwangia harbinensis TaxID=2878561 RepID=UPI001CDA0DAD|nr:STAS domain-containing protein [Jidongwangia harbinensis]MCA2211733.1 STAS domain-containing protein [Jidongwangia harbinensis]